MSTSASRSTLIHTLCMVTFGISRLSSVNSCSSDLGCWWVASDTRLLRLSPAAATVDVLASVEVTGMTALELTTPSALTESLMTPCLDVCGVKNSALRVKSLATGSTAAVDMTVEVETSGLSCVVVGRTASNGGTVSEADNESIASKSCLTSTASLHNCTHNCTHYTTVHTRHHYTTEHTWVEYKLGIQTHRIFNR